VTPEENYTYRISVNGGRVNIMCFGIPPVDGVDEGDYDSVDDLPNWVKDRLAILMMTPIDKPTVDIPSVGRRITGNVYWVYAPEPHSSDESRA